MALKVTTRDNKIQRASKRSGKSRFRRWWVFTGILGVAMIAAPVIFMLPESAPAPIIYPETPQVMQAQKTIGNFGILVPAYLPKGLDRSGFEVKTSNNGPNGVAVVDMAYSSNSGRAITLRQWVPANPGLETLAGAAPVDTTWGRGWRVTPGADEVSTLWVDIGLVRVAISSSAQEPVSSDELVMAANSLGLATELQTYYFVPRLPRVNGITPPAPLKVRKTGEGIQELTLTITPGGYTPSWFVVQRGVPVKITFTSKGDVGSSSTLIFPVEPEERTRVPFMQVMLTEAEPSMVIQYIPLTSGSFSFRSPNNRYRGTVTVTGGDGNEILTNPM